MTQKEILGIEAQAEFESSQGQTSPNPVDEVGKEQLEALDFDELLKNAGDIPVLIDFYADWCVPCRVLEPTINQIANLFGGRVIVAKVDIVGNPDLVERYRILSIPRVTIFKNEAVQVDILGLQSFQVYAEKLDALLAAPEKANSEGVGVDVTLLESTDEHALIE